MAFRCGQNIHITKSEMENTNILPKGVNVFNCINTKSRIQKKPIKITKFEVEKKLNMKSTEIKIELENVKILCLEFVEKSNK